MTIPQSWNVSVRGGAVGELHRFSAAALEEELLGRRLRFWRPDAPAVVLGSAQRADVVGPSANGVAIVRRRTGGGAVYVAPDELVWADVLIPVSDPLWHEDVGQAFWWLGAAWAEALRHVGVPAAAVAVHHGRPVRTRWSSLVCFAGLGSGEVTIDGRKVVGLSQRRTRRGSLFQCAALLHWDPVPLLAVLDLEPGERSAARDELDVQAAAIPVRASSLEAAFAGSLLAPAA